MRAGKISIELIKKLIEPYTGAERKDVVLGPGPGIDAGIVEANERYIVASTDPITAASSMIGRWVVYISSNDVLAAGAQPKWMLLTLIIPVDYDESILKMIMNDVSYALSKVNMALIGGHTEYAPVVKTPIAIGTVIGTSNKVLNPLNIRSGDKIVLFGEVGREGAYILYDVYKETLDELSTEEVRFLEDTPENLSLYPLVKQFSDEVWGGIRYMHDPTEGGVLNGAYEVSLAAGRSINLYRDAIIVHPAVEKICRKLGLDPLRLLSSGTLLVVASKDHATLLEEMGGSVIGEVVNEDKPNLYLDGEYVNPKEIEKDEIWKALD